MSQESDDQELPADKDKPILDIIDEHEEEVMTSGGKKERHKGVYLLPNLFTTAALFAGFYAIVAGMKGNFEYAGMAIIIAQLLDGFDGRVARMTNTTSAFGVEYDSLSDMISFGLAPSLVMYSWGLDQLGKVGWVAAFIFTACAALRLARFNTQVGKADKRYFLGLASPPAAAILATTVWCWHDSQPSYELSLLLALLTMCVGLLMVSNIRYSSFKGLDLRGRVPFVVMFCAVLGFVVVILNPPTVLLAMAATYCVSGPIMWLLNLRKSKAETSAE